MAIEFRCTECDKLLRTPDDTAGKQAKCPECGAIMQIPTPPPREPPANPFGPVAPDTLPRAGSPSAHVSGSPFSASLPPPEGAAESDNPYQSPTDYQALPAGGFSQPVPDLRVYSLSRVAGPAIALIVTGALGLVVQLISVIFQLATINMGMRGGRGGGPDPALIMASSGINVFFGCVAIVMAILVILGAVRMKNLRNYGLSMTSAIVAMIPCVSPCCLLGLPFGIWALVVLSDGRVQAAFRK